MDSLSQIALGSAVGLAVMGRRTAAWKAALAGAVFGTVPDLDSFISHGDAIRTMTFHRTESHSLYYLSIVSPLLAWLTVKVMGEAQLFLRWWLAVWLILITHPLLDVMTIYGTQLALPFTNYPYGVGSIFIIDPLYTLPLLICVIVALVRRNGAGLRWNAAGLILSTTYLAWSVAAQAHVTQIAQQSITQLGWSDEKILVTPTPFNTLLWRVVVILPEGYAEGFYGLLDESTQINFKQYQRGEQYFDFIEGDWEAERIAWFSHGFFKMHEDNDQLLITDLRMGQEPYYAFNFVLAERYEEQWGKVPPEQIQTNPEAGPAFKWLWRRMRGEVIDPPWH